MRIGNRPNFYVTKLNLSGARCFIMCLSPNVSSMSGFRCFPCVWRQIFPDIAVSFSYTSAYTCFVLVWLQKLSFCPRGFCVSDAGCFLSVWFQIFLLCLGPNFVYVCVCVCVCVYVCVYVCVCVSVSVSVSTPFYESAATYCFLVFLQKLTLSHPSFYVFDTGYFLIVWCQIFLLCLALDLFYFYYLLFLVN